MPLELFTKSSEVKLMEILNRLRVQPAGWLAIHFHLSDLLEEYKSEYQVKIAINLIHDLLKGYDGNMFLLTDHSIIVLCYALEQAVLEKLIFQLRYLYMDDPLAYTDNGQENPAFCRVYNLMRDGQQFMDLCSERMGKFARKPSPSQQPSAKPPQPEKPREERPDLRIPVLEQPQEPPADFWLEPIDVSGKVIDKGMLSAPKLAIIERDLNQADLHKVIRRQPVCAVLGDMTVRRVFDELYLHINHLRHILRSEVDFLSNRWLFKYLTRTLDERMLEMIRREPGRYLDQPVSLNLNVETLLSSQFTEFDAMIKPATKVSIVIEIPVTDVFADMTAFMIARDQLHKLGYRVCLDGLTAASFASISREKLGFDLVKVQWNADVQDDLFTRKNLDLADSVQLAGGNRIILCRCDNKSAVAFGHALGISLFQGRYIDGVLNPAARVEN